MLALVLVLTACGTTKIDASSTGVWDRYIVYNFAKVIKALSLGGNTGIGIILFTILVRIILLPLMKFQTNSMKATQKLQPKIKELQEKYPGKDAESKRKMQEEQQRLYAEHGVNPMAGCLPLLVQMPIMMAVWQAISRVPELTQGKFIWLELGTPDKTFILPIIAAIFTFASSKLASMSQTESNASITMMNYLMPLMILFMGINLASGLSLYWVVSNGFQVIQTLMINNPFTQRREAEEEARLAKEKERALEKAKKSKKKRKK
ncbi:YidC/Oxa1 family membrane protein insertase [Vagococcus zengguangii]|uniref:Membrane protein insertase YidC n=1 Tax=Vagococcus zengguangii TaxID=2571750 RepID=A0A4D7D0H6_9ENTE|nr:YidC/Oxa1 family membrane protein insertase [Vagococcus zengguangii]QCI87420.1 membrane protein insertase YidC [Vagococcus zengguangii]TLG80095.1 membrane protein insertase YidC [Vagococcus zengguangii]